MTDNNLESRIRKMKKEVIERLQSINIQTAKVDSWNNPEYLKKILSNVDGQVDDMPAGEYILDFDIIIRKNGLLRLKPGTILKFDYDKGIICTGTFYAKGVKGNEIIFTSHEDGWANIILLDEDSSNSILDYCSVSKGRGREEIGMVDNIMTGFPGSQSGGGIRILRSSPQISNSSIYNNEFIDGGGIGIKGGDAKILNCKMYNNTADLFGGGIYIEDDSNAIIRNCHIYRNRTQGWSSAGGGIYVDSTEYPDIQYNDIRENQANSGAGVSIGGFGNGNPTFRKNTVTFNVAKDRSGGVSLPIIGELSFDKPNYKYEFAKENMLNYNTIHSNTPNDVS